MSNESEYQEVKRNFIELFEKQKKWFDKLQSIKEESFNNKPEKEEKHQVDQINPDDPYMGKNVTRFTHGYNRFKAVMEESSCFFNINYFGIYQHLIVDNPIFRSPFNIKTSPLNDILGYYIYNTTDVSIINNIKKHFGIGESVKYDDVFLVVIQNPRLVVVMSDITRSNNVLMFANGSNNKWNVFGGRIELVGVLYIPIDHSVITGK
jgi:hypothetical protein